ncbi:MAG: proton-conducting transporter membrane subunit, partial [Chloroflexaceae bacterium]|nr:proton-conducting transporter membrane subunit [Chloroflexaceae bacterium]
ARRQRQMCIRDRAGGRLEQVIPWVPRMGLELRFALDGLSMLFALLVSGIGVLVALYTAYYLAGDPGMGRFYLTLFIFMGAMLGLVLADNVLTMFMFWELTSVSSYLLVGYKHDYPSARRGAQMGLLITVGGGLALLVGLVLLGNAAGSYTISEILAAGERVKASPLYTPAMLLIFLGCFTKSAQFPFHFWLPNAMQAPTPASAYLHSATMVKAGVYLLARLHPTLSDTPLWLYTLTIVGMTTMLVGAVVANRRDDIKGLLAYSTISKLGTMVLLAGMGGPEAPAALVATILAHALYKGALFMLAGAVDHEAGTRSLAQLGGLRRAMPWTTALAILSSLSMAGVPILFGFVAKEEQLYAAVDNGLPPGLDIVVLIAVVTSAVFGVLYSWRLVSGVFFGPRGSGMKEHVHEAPAGMLLGPAILTILSVVLPLGLLPATATVLQPAVNAISNEGAKISLYLFPSEIGLPLILSMTALLIGAVLTRFEPQIVAAPSPLPPWLNGDRIYDAAVEGVLQGATAFTRTLQNGKLRSYMTWAVLSLVAVVAPPLVFFGFSGLALPTLDGVEPFEFVSMLLIPIGVIATLQARTRLGAIIAASFVGLMVAYIFVIYSAPDLALTQLLVEILTTVFLVLLFALMPASFERLTSPSERSRDGLIAVIGGLVFAGIAFAASSSTALSPISQAFRAESQTQGFGDNVVNVILVDFRGFDTMGEIVVLFIALLGIYAMLRLRPGAGLERDDEEAPAQPAGPEAGALRGNGQPGGATPKEEEAPVAGKGR